MLLSMLRLRRLVSSDKKLMFSVYIIVPVNSTERNSWSTLNPAGIFDVLTWSHLVTVRMALWHVWQALLLWFGTTPAPSVDDVGRRLGVSGSSTGPVSKLLHCVLGQEAGLALIQQNQTKLRGFIQADGTSVRHYKVGTDLMYIQWFGMIQGGPLELRSRKLLLFLWVLPEQVPWENHHRKSFKNWNPVVPSSSSRAVQMERSGSF